MESIENGCSLHLFSFLLRRRDALTEAPHLVSTSTQRPGFLQTSTLPALRLAAEVGGYAWWYIEVHDVSQRFGLTLIVFAGSVFSAEYAARLRRGEPVTGLDVPAVNLALYERPNATARPRQKLWVMNEYPASVLKTDEHSIAIAHSSLRADLDGSLVIDLHEPSTRFFGKPGPLLTGQIRLSPPQVVLSPIVIGQAPGGGTHFWQPLSLFSSAEVHLRLTDDPIEFRGTAYCDHNFGGGRLEDCFSRWGWAHGFADDRSVGAVVYDTTLLNGQRHRIGLLLRQSDHEPELTDSSDPPPDEEPAPDGADFLWLKVPRVMSAGTLRGQRTRDSQLLDAPFYARFGVELSDDVRLPGILLRGVGEYLDLTRFRRPGLQFLLRYKTHHVNVSDDAGRA